MPQTREHFDICRLLGLSRGVIALTKADLVDEEGLELARLDVADLVRGSFLDDAPIICVSSKTGEGLAELTNTLSEAARTLPSRAKRYVTRLPIDRSFSIKGFGAVVTGTLASGEVHDGAELELLPEGDLVRVRGLQTHGRTVATAHAGQRVAANLGGIAHTDVGRGMVLVQPGVLKPTQAIDAYIDVLPTSSRPIRSRQRVRVHLGTAEVLARIQVLNDRLAIEPGQNGYAQIRIEEPAVGVMGERFIIRTYSPQMTIAGGEIVDPLAARHRRRDFSLVTTLLDEVRKGDEERKIELLVAAAGEGGVGKDELAARTGFTDGVLRSAIDKNTVNGRLTECDSYYVSTLSFEKLRITTLNAVAAFHKAHPLVRGITMDSLRVGPLANAADTVSRSVIRSLEPDVIIEKDIVRLTSHLTEVSPIEAAFMDSIKRIYREARFEVPKTDDAVAKALQDAPLPAKDAAKLLQLMQTSGDLARVTDDMYFDPAIIADLIKSVRDHADRTGNRVLDVAVFKDIAGVSRKYAIPLLEYLDRQKVTTRAGANRVIL